MGNVATANVQFGIKHNIDQELQGLRAAIERNGPAITRGLTDPIAAADQVLSSLGPKLEKLLSTAAKGLPLSSRMMSELQSSAQTLNRLYGGLSGSPLSTPGLTNTLGNLQVARQAIGLAEQASIATQNQAAAIHGVTANTMPAVGMQLSAQDKMQHAVFQSLWQMAESQRQPMGRGYVTESIHQQATRASVQHAQSAKDRQSVQQAMQQEQQTIAEQRQQYLNNLPRLPHTYQVGQERGSFTGRYLRNTPAPMEHVVDTSNMYPSDWQEYVSAKRGALMLPPEALAQRTQGGIRGRMNKEEQESLQRYREFERSRLMKMDSFDIAERQRQAYNRNMDPYRNSVDASFDLTTQFNEQDQLRKNLLTTGRSADTIIGQHNAEKQARAAILKHNEFQEIAIGRQRFSEINASESASVSNRKLGQVKQELELVKSLAQEYGKLSDAKRREIRVNLESMQAAGISGASLPLRAINQVEQLRYGGNSNAMRYGFQNAAFGIEDYLISSQYGGVKAGLRAITNNMTAIAAAATGSLSPVTAGVMIAGVAAAGSLAPGVYDWMTQTSDVSESEREGIRYNTRAADEYASFNQRLNQMRSRPSSASSALSNYLTARDDRQVYQNRASALSNQIQRSVKAISGKNPYTGFGVAGSGFFDAINSPTMGRMLGFDDASTVRNDIIARESLKAQQDQFDTFSQKAIETAVLEKEYLQKLNQRFPEEQNLFNQRQPFIKGLNDIQMRQLRGERINPDEVEKYRQSIELIDRADVRKQLAKEPQSLAVQEELWRQEDVGSRNRLLLEREQFALQGRNQAWALRGRLAGFETDPAKALLSRSKIEAEQIEADPNYSPQEKKNLLNGLMKLTRNGLSSLNKMPDLGGIIEAGSGADIALRQPFFGPRETTKERDARDLGDIKAILERIEKATKDNKPQAANVGRKK